MRIGRLGTSAFYDNGSTAATDVADVPAIEARLHPAAERAPVPADKARLDIGPAPPSAPAVGIALRRYRRVAVGLAVTDAICVTVALLGAYALRYPGELATAREAAVIALAPPVWILVFYTFNLYAPQHLSAHEELRRVIGASGVGIVVLVMVSYWSQSPFSRAWLGLTWVMVLVLELLPRRWWRAYQWRMRMDGRLALRTLVVGTSAESSRLVDHLHVDASGFVPIGYVQVSDPTVSANGLPILGRIGELDLLVRAHAVDCLFVASAGITEADMARVRQVAREAGIEVRVLPNLPQMLTSRLALLTVGNATVVALRSVHLSGPQAAIKRIIDIAVASVALLLSLPLWPVIALAIRLDSRGPVFFHQERVTKDGRIFRMHKFRTMRTGDPGFDTTRPFFKLESDPRLTRVGAFLRRVSLDELPQLWNVLSGDMSIVGPRPLPADQVAANPELLSPRHAVPAGVTGWWQINGRSGVTPEEALRLDLFYIENWSPTLDLFILLKTFGALAKRDGAY
jgi:exopolysaccharide biosynthesis polyprenyl glycosylphosphotransferase